MDARDLVFVTSGYTVIAVEKSTGNKRWQRLLLDRFFKPSIPFVTLLVDESGVYAHVSEELFRLDLNTGAILWQTKLESGGWLKSQRIASLATLGHSSPPTSDAATHARSVERSRNSSS